MYVYTHMMWAVIPVMVAHHLIRKGDAKFVPDFRVINGTTSAPQACRSAPACWPGSVQMTDLARLPARGQGRDREVSDSLAVPGLMTRASRKVNA